MAIILILIVGSSGSGKSTVAQKLLQSSLLSNNKNTKAVLFQQDHYFTTAFLPYDQRHDSSFEDGSGIDWPRLKKDMESSTEGLFISNNNNNNSTVEHVVVVVEGHMLGDARSMFLNDAFDGKAYVLVVLMTCSQEICKQRRLQRQNRTEEERRALEAYMDTFVWPTFCSVGRPSMQALKEYALQQQQQPHQRLAHNHRRVEVLEVSAEQEDSLDQNLIQIQDAIQQFMYSNNHRQGLQTRHRQQQIQQEGEEEIMEQWPSLALDKNWHGFAQHEILTIHLDHHNHNHQHTIQVECVSSLSPLDMVNLSNGTHDATGHSLWMGAFFLVEALAYNTCIKTTTSQNHQDNDVSLRDCFQSKHVLELGCGTGVAGLALLCSPKEWHAKPLHVSFTDNDNDVLDLCRRNCSRQAPNLADTQYSAFSLHWGSDNNVVALPEASSCSECTMFDTVLATDVLYDLACLDKLLFTARQRLKTGGHFVLSHVPRSCLPDDKEEPQETTTTTTTTTSCSDGNDYHARLERHIIDTAATFCLQLVSIVRPEEMIKQTRTIDKEKSSLNSVSLIEMAEAGATILLLRKKKLTNTIRD